MQNDAKVCQKPQKNLDQNCKLIMVTHRTRWNPRVSFDLPALTVVSVPPTNQLCPRTARNGGATANVTRISWVRRKDKTWRSETINLSKYEGSKKTFVRIPGSSVAGASLVANFFALALPHLRGPRNSHQHSRSKFFDCSLLLPCLGIAGLFCSKKFILQAWSISGINRTMNL